MRRRYRAKNMETPESTEDKLSAILGGMALPLFHEFLAMRLGARGLLVRIFHHRPSPKYSANVLGDSPVAIPFPRPCCLYVWRRLCSASASRASTGQIQWGGSRPTSWNGMRPAAAAAAIFCVMVGRFGLWRMPSWWARPRPRLCDLVASYRHTASSLPNFTWSTFYF